MNTLDKITKLLKDRNIEQRELAAYLGISAAIVSEWKSGKTQSYKKYLAKIAEFFNVPYDYFTNDSVEQPIYDSTSYDMLTAFNKLSLADKSKVLNLIIELETQSTKNENAQLN